MEFYIFSLKVEPKNFSAQSPKTSWANLNNSKIAMVFVHERFLKAEHSLAWKAPPNHYAVKTFSLANFLGSFAKKVFLSRTQNNGNRPRE